MENTLTIRQIGVKFDVKIISTKSDLELAIFHGNIFHKRSLSDAEIDDIIYSLQIHKARIRGGY